MSSSLPAATVYVLFGVLTVLCLIRKSAGLSSRVEAYLPYLWTFFLVFTVDELISFKLAVWILAPLCFVGLREYFSLLDIRLQDRWGIWGAYLSIPFMIFFIQIQWYGMFIISIPVYAFLAIPFLVVLGGKETEGTIFSVGAIDFGLFLLVYCVGHIGYLASVSTWMAIMLLLDVTACDLVGHVLKSWGSPQLADSVKRYLFAIPATLLLTVSLSGWTGIPLVHSVILGALIPILVAIGRYTIVYIEADLGIVRDRLIPGRGRIINSSASSLYAAPIVFHYLRYFMM